MKKLLLILLISLLLISCNDTPKNTPGSNPSSESGTGNSENKETPPETNPGNNDDQEDALTEAEIKEIFDDFHIKYIFEPFIILSESYPDNDLPLVEGLDSGATSVTDKVVSFPEIGLEVKVDLTYEKQSGDDFTIVNTIQIKELSIDNPDITEIVLNTSKSSYDHEVGSGNILYIDSIKIKGHLFTDISTGIIDDVLNYWSSMTQYINNDNGLSDKLGAYTEPVSGYEVNYSDADASISATGTLDILKIADNEFTLTGTLDFVTDSCTFKVGFDKAPIVKASSGLDLNPISETDEGMLNILKTLKFNDIEYSKLLLVIINSMD